MKSLTAYLLTQWLLCFIILGTNIYRPNFLILDIYYEALQKETTEEVPAYVTMHFLGKIKTKKSIVVVRSKLIY